MKRFTPARTFLMIFSMFAVSCTTTTSGTMPPMPELDLPAPTEDEKTRTAVFAGGCFWCVEAVFEQLDGVIDVVSGYAGGTKEDANYKAVSTGRTGHAEVIQITYDPHKITFGKLLQVHFYTHDPTTLNRQGADVGPQYRSAIFVSNEQEKRVVEAYIRQLNESKYFSRPIVTTIEPLEAFFPAEEYHQDFATNNPQHPYIRNVSDPKVQKIRKALGLE